MPAASGRASAAACSWAAAAASRSRWRRDNRRVVGRRDFAWTIARTSRCGGCCAALRPRWESSASITRIPRGRARPSRRDVAEAMYPDWIHVIIGLAGRTPEVRAFRWRAAARRRCRFAGAPRRRPGPAVERRRAPEYDFWPVRRSAGSLGPQPPLARSHPELTSDRSTHVEFTGSSARAESATSTCCSFPSSGDDRLERPAGPRRGHRRRARARAGIRRVSRASSTTCSSRPLTGGRWKARRVAFVGAGAAAEADAERWRRIARDVRLRGAPSIAPSRSAGSCAAPPTRSPSRSTPRTVCPPPSSMAGTYKQDDAKAPDDPRSAV